MSGLWRGSGNPRSLDFGSEIFEVSGLGAFGSQGYEPPRPSGRTKNGRLGGRRYGARKCSGGLPRCTSPLRWWGNRPETAGREGRTRCESGKAHGLRGGGLKGQNPEGARKSTRGATQLYQAGRKERAGTPGSWRTARRERLSQESATLSPEYSERHRNPTRVTATPNGKPSLCLVRRSGASGRARSQERTIGL
jgi:hypothetical protein